MRREARLALSNWIQDGENAWLFDNLDDSITFSKFQVFELQGTEDEEMSVFLEPLLFYLFKRWEQTIQDPALLGVEKILHIDEAWRYLLNETVRKKVLSVAKRIRKHNGGVYFVTQSPEDIRRVGMLGDLNEIFPTRMWLSNPTANIAEYISIFGWNEAEAAVFQSLAPKRDVMVKKGNCPAEKFYVNLSPEDLALVGNDPVGNIRREKVKGKRRAAGAAAAYEFAEGEV
jgi:type IV secretory pathway VirB4 component